MPRSRMRGAIPPPQYAFMALCSVKVQVQFYLYINYSHLWSQLIPLSCTLSVIKHKVTFIISTDRFGIVATGLTWIRNVPSSNLGWVLRGECGEITFTYATAVSFPVPSDSPYTSFSSTYLTLIQRRTGKVRVWPYVYGFSLPSSKQLWSLVSM
jgi:hypothetical protein